MDKKTMTAAEARKDYLKAWRKRNKDKVRQYNENYWQRRAEKMQKGEDGEKNA